MKANAKGGALSALASAFLKPRAAMIDGKNSDTE